MKSKRLALGILVMCLASVSVAVFGQDPEEPPEGIPVESDWLYRKHYAQVEGIMAQPPGQREKSLEAYFKKLQPQAKIRQYMPSFFAQIVKDYQSAGNTAGANAAQAKMLELFPHLKPSPLQEAQAALQSKDYDTAIAKGEAAYASEASGPAAAIVASSYIAKQDGPKAAEWSDKALTKLGAKEGAYYAAWLYEYHRGQNQIPQALGYYDKLVKAFPNSAPTGWDANRWAATRGQAEFLRAFNTYSQANYKRAIDQFYESLKYAANEQAYVFIGLSHWKEKEMDEAMSAFAVATVMNRPGSAKAREYLEQIYSARNGGSLDGLDAMLEEAKKAIQ